MGQTPACREERRPQGAGPAAGLRKGGHRHVQRPGRKTLPHCGQNALPSLVGHCTRTVLTHGRESGLRNPSTHNVHVAIDSHIIIQQNSSRDSMFTSFDSVILKVHNWSGQKNRTKICAGRCSPETARYGSSQINYDTRTRKTLCAVSGGCSHRGYKNSAGGALRDTMGVAPSRRASRWLLSLPGPRTVFVKTTHLLQDDITNTCVVYQHTGARMTCVGQLSHALLTDRKGNACKESSAKAGTSWWALERVWTLWGPFQGAGCVGPGQVLSFDGQDMVTQV